MRFALLTLLMYSWIGAGTPPARNVQIVDIPKAGLFRLSDGNVVALAHVRLPADTAYNRLQKQMVIYARQHFVRRRARVEYSGAQNPNGKPLAHLTIWYPLETLNVNKQFLLKGFGWFTEQGDSLNLELYRKAEVFAQNHKQGVWNPKSYGDLLFNQYFLSAHFGYGSGTKETHTLTFQSMSLRWEPLKAVSGLEADVSLLRILERGDLCCECDYVEPHQPHIRTQVSNLVDAYIQYNQNWKYGGFSAGLSWLYLGDLYCSEAPGMVVLPRLSGRAGWLDKLYISVVAFDFSNISLLTTGLTYVFSEHGEQISISGSWLGGQTVVGAQARLRVWKHWIATATGKWYQDDSDNYTFFFKKMIGLLGFGYVFE